MVVDFLRSSRFRHPAVLGLAAPGVLTLFFGYHVFGGRLPASTDLSMLHLQFFALRFDGSLPLWNPYSGIGVPMAGDFQFAALYPPRWPFFFLPWDRWLNFYLLIHYLVALAGAYGLLRRFGLSTASCLGGSVAYLCGGFMMAYVITLTVFCAACWLPWLLWGASTRRRYGPPLAGSAMAMIILIGSPHLMFYGAVGWLLFQAVQAGEVVRSGRPRGVAAFGRSALFLALGIAAGGGALVPGLLNVRNSVRTESNVMENLDKSLGWNEIGRVLFGGSGGAVYPEFNDKVIYVGGVGLVLIAIGLLAGAPQDAGRESPGSGRGLRAVAVGLVGLGVAFALGRHVGWQYIFPHVPGLDLLAGPARALVLTAMGFALLAGLGLEAAGSAGGRRLGLAVAAGALTMGVAMALHPARFEGMGPVGAFALWWGFPDALVGSQFLRLDLPVTFALAAAALACRSLLGERVRWVLAAMLVVQLLHFAPRVRPRAVERENFAPPGNVAWLASQPKLPPFRVSAMDPLQATDTEWDSHFRIHFLQPNTSTLYGIEALANYNPLQDAGFQEFIEQRSGLAPFNDPIRHTLPARHDLAMYRDLGVRYVIGRPWDQRVTHRPTVITPEHPVAEVAVGSLAGVELEAWLFVSFLAGETRPPRGEPVAELILQSGADLHRLPLRYGEHTALAVEPRGSGERGLPPIQSGWRQAAPGAEGFPFVDSQAYRGTLEFPEPLSVDRAFWRLLRADLALQVTTQAVRRHPSPGEAVAWALRFDDPAAPVYEWLESPGRVRILPGAVPGNLAERVNLDRAEPVEVTYREHLQSRSAFRVRNPADGLLVIADAWHPGWRASVDGTPSPVVPVNDLFQGIGLPAGEHEIELRFEPRLFYLLCAAAALAGATLAVAVVRGALAEFRRNGEGGAGPIPSSAGVRG